MTTPFDAESAIMKKLTNVVTSGEFPNFPIMFASLKCTCEGICDERIKTKIFGLPIGIYDRDDFQSVKCIQPWRAASVERRPHSPM